MINQNLHVQPVALDSVPHRELKLGVPVTDWSVAKKLNALFVAAAEFGDVCREYPIVFVRAGKDTDGTDSIAPIAVMGLSQEQNLFLQNGGAEVICFNIANYLVHRLSDAYLGSQMINDIYVLERGYNSFGITDFSANKFGIFI